jgi:hypothetical protein
MQTNGSTGMVQRAGTFQHDHRLCNIHRAPAADGNQTVAGAAFEHLDALLNGFVGRLAGRASEKLERHTRRRQWVRQRLNEAARNHKAIGHHQRCFAPDSRQKVRHLGHTTATDKNS